MISKSDAIKYQLGLSAPEAVTFEEGGSTVLSPAKFVPAIANSAPVPLDGEWQMTLWPFPVAEDTLVGPTGGGVVWSAIEQPGKVFFYDPEQLPSSIPNWDRVTLAHIEPDDGAIIRREVTVPEDWAGKRVILRFEGIYPAGKIYWDGKLVGEQWSGLTTIELDVTDLAGPGSHTVAVRLYRKHQSVQLDMPRHSLEFAGISRSAFIHVVEQVHVSDIRLQPELSDNYTRGRVSGEILLKNASAAKSEVTVNVHIADTDGSVVIEKAYTASVAPGGESRIDLDIAAGKVKTWNAEKPNLYQLMVRVVAPGQRPQCIKQKIGFRCFELKGQRPTLNGNPVKFRGVNHLTFHPEHGMYTPEPWLRQCLTMMKRANVNAIRTHFYGPPELTDLCDELGIYLLQELPIDWGHTYFADPVHLGPALHRMEACVRRDRNHPSVMVWSIGNENLPRTEEEHDVFFDHLRLANAMVKRMDPTRPTMFPPPGPANKIEGIFETRIGEIADIHYSFNLVRKLNETGVLTNPRTWTPTFETHTREELIERGWSGTWFSSEYGIMNKQPDLNNAPYLGLIADVEEDPLSGKSSHQAFIDRMNVEWGLMRDDPTCLGGAYFAWIGAGAGDQWGWVRWGEDADWGVVTGDLLPKPAFWAMRWLFSPVVFPDHIVWKKGQKEAVITVHNAYNGIDFSECTFRLLLGGTAWGSMMREFKDIPVSCAPGQSVDITIRMPQAKGLDEGGTALCRFVVLEPSGFRAIMADVLVMSEENAAVRTAAPMPIGPDAIMA